MIDVSPYVAAELPVDELALRVLKDLADTDEWNEYNYLLIYESASDWQDSVRVIAEATGWLRAQGFIALKPGDSSGNAIL
jgi:hypothetical protein